MIKCIFIGLLTFMTWSWARAQGGPNPFAGMTRSLGLFAPPQPWISYSGSFAPKENPAAIENHRLNLSYPLAKTEKDSYTIGLNLSHLHLSESRTLSKNGLATPKSLQRHDLNLGYNRTLGPMRSLGIRGTIGVASDKPFQDPQDTTFNLSTFYSYPGSNQGIWVLSAFISNNSPILNYVPIPGFFYLKKTDTVTYIVGIPLASVVWTPTEDLRVSASAFGPSLNLEIGQSEQKSWPLFAGFSWTPQTFLRANREDRQDRLFYDEKRLFLGVRKSILGQLSTEFQIGQAYDRRMTEGERFSDFEGGQARFRSSPFAAWNFNLTL